jgi:ACT domain-containing protein
MSKTKNKTHYRYYLIKESVKIKSVDIEVDLVDIMCWDPWSIPVQFFKTDNNDGIKTLLDTKAKSSDIDKIRAIMNQINFIQDLLLMIDEAK